MSDRALLWSAWTATALVVGLGVGRHSRRWPVHRFRRRLDDGADRLRRDQRVDNHLPALKQNWVAAHGPGPRVVALGVPTGPADRAAGPTHFLDLCRRLVRKLVLAYGDVPALSLPPDFPHRTAAQPPLALAASPPRRNGDLVHRPGHLLAVDWVSEPDLDDYQPDRIPRTRVLRSVLQPALDNRADGARPRRSGLDDRPLSPGEPGRAGPDETPLHRPAFLRCGIRDAGAYSMAKAIRSSSTSPSRSRLSFSLL